MTLLSSLRSRIFITSALLSLLSIGVAIFLVNIRVTREAERALQREIAANGDLVDQLRTTSTQDFTVMARLTADLSILKAAVETNDPPTVQDIANGYQTQLKSNLLLVTNRAGGVLATVGATPRAAEIVASQPIIREARAGRESFTLLPQPRGILQVVTVPILLGRTQPETLGTLSVGFLLDDALAAQLKRNTGSDIAFGMDGQILASTMPKESEPQLANLLRGAGAGVSQVTIGGEEFAALRRPLSVPGDSGAGPVALILRSRSAELRSLQAIHAGLGVTAIVAVLLATVLSFGVARTIMQPLAATTGVMREVAATGDLTRKIVLGRRWVDEDARLLAATFNALTDSVARAQREMAQKERLSSLGRLSTVIAHEVRNPLMIIKATLHTMRQRDLSPESLREAIADIDEEVVRLNRIVNEVLDFSRPIPFDLAPADLNTLCRESAAAAEAAGPGAPITLELDSALPAVTSDAERLRMALVNMLVNARHAVAGHHGNGGAGGAARPGDVTLRTRADGARATIVVEDCGAGIAAADLARVFDPYFTTKRGGTGLGLPIAKNIIEGLGGTIGVTSTPGAGTEIRIELPI